MVTSPRPPNHKKPASVLDAHRGPGTNERAKTSLEKGDRTPEREKGVERGEYPPSTWLA